MKKYWILLYAISLLGIYFYSIQTHSYYVLMLFSLNHQIVLYTFISASILLTYYFVSSIRIYFVKYLVLFGGLTAIIFGFSSLMTPTLWGYMVDYIPFGDTLMLIESGVLASLIALELPVYSKLTKPHYSFIAQSILYDFKNVKRLSAFIPIIEDNKSVFNNYFDSPNKVKFGIMTRSMNHLNQIRINNTELKFYKVK